MSGDGSGEGAHGACSGCGHDPACGFASTWSEATGEQWWCHDDDHSCYAIDGLAAAMNMDDPEPVVVVDQAMTPTGVLIPCPSRVDGPFLATDASYLSCAHLNGHRGPHLFHVEWGTEREAIPYPMPPSGSSAPSGDGDNVKETP